MKFRPQIQLRFRDEEQYLRVKLEASAVSVSLNEFVLRKLESVEQGGGTTDALVHKTSAARAVSKMPTTDVPAIKDHDTETCRVYKCGQCAVLKVGEVQGTGKVKRLTAADFAPKK